MLRIAYSRDAVRTLSRMPANTSRLIRSKLEHYAADPAALANNVKALKGEPGVLRLRVGDWRILFTQDGTVIAVIRIAPRGSAYDWEGAMPGRARFSMDTQIITTPAGERMVLLAEADYAALVAAAEDNADRAAVATFRRRIAAGEEELVPAAVVDRLLSGESRIRVWREHRGLKAGELAARAGIAQAFLSQIETGKRDGTVGTYRRIADALGVSLDDLAG